MTKFKFPFDHVVKVPEKEVWVKCNSSITAMGIGAVVKKYYPGYAPKLCSERYLNELKQKQTVQ
jgi:hypothetical protein